MFNELFIFVMALLKILVGSLMVAVATVLMCVSIVCNCFYFVLRIGSKSAG